MDSLACDKAQAKQGPTFKTGKLERHLERVEKSKRKKEEGCVILV